MIGAYDFEPSTKLVQKLAGSGKSQVRLVIAYSLPPGITIAVAVFPACLVLTAESLLTHNPSHSHSPVSTP